MIDNLIDATNELFFSIAGPIMTDCWVYLLLFALAVVPTTGIWAACYSRLVSGLYVFAVGIVTIFVCYNGPLEDANEHSDLIAFVAFILLTTLVLVWCCICKVVRDKREWRASEKRRAEIAARPVIRSSSVVPKPAPKKYWHLESEPESA